MSDLVHALADAHGRSKMVDGVDAFEGSREIAFVANVADGQFHFRVEVVGTLLLGTVN